jgi:hypothetical protein
MLLLVELEIKYFNKKFFLIKTFKPLRISAKGSNGGERLVSLIIARRFAFVRIGI